MFSIKLLQIFSHVYGRDNKENAANSQASLAIVLLYSVCCLLVLFTSLLGHLKDAIYLLL